MLKPDEIEGLAQKLVDAQKAKNEEQKMKKLLVNPGGARMNTLRETYAFFRNLWFPFSGFFGPRTPLTKGRVTDTSV